MRRILLASVAGLVLAAIGFTAAAFASGDHHRWVGGGSTTATTSTSTTGTTGTTTTEQTTTTAPTTTTTSTTGSSPKVIVCHRTGSWKHPWVDMSIDRHALRAYLRHGDKVGRCRTLTTTTTTTTAPTTTTATSTTATTTTPTHARLQKHVQCRVVYVRVKARKQERRKR